VHSGLFLAQVFNLYRSLGLRHIPVLRGEAIVGIITRKELTNARLHELDHQFETLTADRDRSSTKGSHGGLGPLPDDVGLERAGGAGGEGWDERVGEEGTAANNEVSALARSRSLHETRLPTNATPTSESQI